MNKLLLSILICQLAVVYSAVTGTTTTGYLTAQSVKTNEIATNTLYSDNVFSHKHYINGSQPAESTYIDFSIASSINKYMNPSDPQYKNNVLVLCEGILYTAMILQYLLAQPGASCAQCSCFAKDGTIRVMNTCNIADVKDDCVTVFG